MMKKLLGIVVLGLFWNNVGFADNHHSFLTCENNIELEVDLKKNKVFVNGHVFEIGEKDDLYIYAKKKSGTAVNYTLNINRYTGRLNYWERGKGTKQYNCEILEKKF